MTGVHIMVSCHPWGGLNESFRKCLPELDDCPSHLCATHAGRERTRHSPPCDRPLHTPELPVRPISALLTFFILGTSAFLAQPVVRVRSRTAV